MTRIMRYAYPVGALGFVVLAGCADQGYSDAFATRDSAGITIAESPKPAWNEAAGWTIDLSPSIAIGVAEGDSTQQLFRVSGAVRVSEDTLVVVNGGSSEIRWYHADGTLIRSAGREGAGPGEFGRLGPTSVCMLPGGRILVGDPTHQRANIFSSGGEFVSVVQLDATSAFPSIQGCFADGTLLSWRAVGPAERVPGTLINTQLVWSHLDQNGRPLTELIELPSSPQYLLADGSGGATYHTIPFTTRPSAAPGADRLYVAPGNAPLIEKRHLDGTVEMSIRWVPDSERRSGDMLARYRTYMIEAQTRPGRRSAWSRFFDLDLDMPEKVAVVQSLIVDAGQSIWAERFRLPWDSISDWDVFEPGGAWLGAVEVPRGLRVLQIGRDFVLGVSRDDLGVERIHLHRLQH